MGLLLSCFRRPPRPPVIKAISHPYPLVPKNVNANSPTSPRANPLRSASPRARPRIGRAEGRGSPLASPGYASGLTGAGDEAAGVDAASKENGHRHVRFPPLGVEGRPPRARSNSGPASSLAHVDQQQQDDSADVRGGESSSVRHHRPSRASYRARPLSPHVPPPGRDSSPLRPITHRPYILPSPLDALSLSPTTHTSPSLQTTSSASPIQSLPKRQPHASPLHPTPFYNASQAPSPASLPLPLPPAARSPPLGSSSPITSLASLRSLTSSGFSPGQKLRKIHRVERDWDYWREEDWAGFRVEVGRGGVLAQDGARRGGGEGTEARNGETDRRPQHQDRGRDLATETAHDHGTGVEARDGLSDQDGQDSRRGIEARGAGPPACARSGGVQDRDQEESDTELSALAHLHELGWSSETAVGAEFGKSSGTRG